MLGNVRRPRKEGGGASGRSQRSRVDLRQDMRRAKAKQAKAERERRA
jgi:hypothetical protein